MSPQKAICAGRDIAVLVVQNPIHYLSLYMPVRKAITEKDGVYFITFTCTNWLPLFKTCNAYDAVYN